MRSGIGFPGPFFGLACGMMIRMLFTCLFAAMTLVATASGSVASERHALVIGNSAYLTAPLPNPVNDADLMAQTLSGLGFHVKLHKNLTRKDMQRAIVDFGQGLEEAPKGSVALIFYAGHGIRIDGENYLIPVDAEISDPLDVKIEGVQASTVLETLNRYEGLNIVVLDACRNNPFEGSTRSGGGGLARMDAPTGTLVAFSTAPGRVAEDGVGSNSAYTRALAQSMQIPGLKVEDVFKRVRIEVLERTDKRQVPWESSSLIGDFYFAGPPVAGAPPVSQPLPVQPQPVQQAPRASIVSGDIELAMADPLPGPSGFLFPDALNTVDAVPPTQPTPVDGVWRLDITGETRFRIDRGRIYTVDGYHLLPATSVSPGKITGHSFKREGVGSYTGYDVTISGPVQMVLQPDMTMKLVGNGSVVHFESRMILVAADDPAAFEDELLAVRAKQ